MTVSGVSRSHGGALKSPQKQQDSRNNSGCEAKPLSQESCHTVLPFRAVRCQLAPFSGLSVSGRPPWAGRL